MSEKMIRCQVNGEEREVGENVTVSKLLEEIGTPCDRVAVELNLEVLDHGRFENTMLKDGDRLEIISFVGGGVL